MSAILPNVDHAAGGRAVEAQCRWCNDDLEHCHESLVIHAVGESHCMDADCSTPAELHHLVVSCADFGCGCTATAAADIA